LDEATGAIRVFLDVHYPSCPAAASEARASVCRQSCPKLGGRSLISRKR